MYGTGSQRLYNEKAVDKAPQLQFSAIASQESVFQVAWDKSLDALLSALLVCQASFALVKLS